MWSRLSFYTKSYKYSVPFLGAVATLPLLAAGQGAYFLARFRQNHRDAPRPVSPSQGIVIAKSNKRKPEEQAVGNWWYNWRHRFNASNLADENQIPLSLLVIGDSLAAGVGSTSGTPKLPEAIARSLSTALGGRPVLWTCHGTPGAATSQIIQDIKYINGDQTDDEDLCDKSITSDSNQLITSTPASNPNAPDDSQRRKRNFSRHSFTFNGSPSSKGENCSSNYDVVVVLTGLNDLKQIFLPFMHDERANENGFKEELRRMFILLSEKMKLNTGRLKLPGTSGSSSTGAVLSTDQGTPQSGGEDVKSPHRRGRRFRHHHQEESHQLPRNPKPVVVIPALPTRPVPLLQYPPLCWIIHILCEIIDEQKRALSIEYPGDILFVEAPSIQMIDDIESGRSLLAAKRKAETLLLDLKDSTHQARNKIEKLIQKHVDSTGSSSSYDCKEEDSSEREMESHYETSCECNLTNTMPDFIGSKLISFDRVHPNDDGYDFWGRHIAEEIIKSWKVPQGIGDS